MTDEPILHRINELSHEEEELWGRAGDGSGLESGERQRLEAISVQLDQCYDLLRQRQARREFGEDPDLAQPRSAEVVERYVG